MLCGGIGTRCGSRRPKVFRIHRVARAGARACNHIRNAIRLPLLAPGARRVADRDFARIRPIRAFVAVIYVLHARIRVIDLRRGDRQIGRLGRSVVNALSAARADNVSVVFRRIGRQANAAIRAEIGRLVLEFAAAVRASLFEFRHFAVFDDFNSHCFVLSNLSDESLIFFFIILEYLVEVNAQYFVHVFQHLFILC